MDYSFASLPPFLTKIGADRPSQAAAITDSRLITSCPITAAATPATASNAGSPPATQQHEPGQVRAERRAKSWCGWRGSVWELTLRLSPEMRGV